ncbi:MAG TPA: tRNA lysidine(34) synthetase TilS [Candidatus Coprenecus merdigallinarum]|nr:tRNA lysidine(34) synthetase TilS [Candidatus Coprenecus merdigallinarum]
MDIIREFNSALAGLSDGRVEGRRYLLGVSGGIDSMCMAALFLRSELHPQFAVAHVNFSLRGEESDGDMTSVEEWGHIHGVRVFTRTFDTKAYASENSVSTQMAARELRYGFFKELMDSEGFDFLSIAHNLDDSIETIFLNIARGTGLRGLAGIPVRNGRIIRPLLGVSRAQIRAYVAEEGVSYRDDHTNFESHYARNRVRNIIFPEFRKINPSFLNTVRRDSEYFREASQIIDGVYEGVRSRTCTQDGGVLLIDTRALLTEGHCGYWLNRMLREYGFNSGQVADIVRCMDSGQNGRVFRSGSHELLYGTEKMKVYPLMREEEGELCIDRPGVYDFKGLRFRIDFFPKPAAFSPVSDGSVLYFAADGLNMPLLCRGWRPADRFRPFGMRRGSKKLSDFFTDLKLDRIQKQAQPVLLDADGSIVCLPGLRIDDRFKIKTPTTVVAGVSILSR